MNEPFDPAAARRRFPDLDFCSDSELEIVVRFIDADSLHPYEHHRCGVCGEPVSRNAESISPWVFCRTHRNGFVSTPITTAPQPKRPRS